MLDPTTEPTTPVEAAPAPEPDPFHNHAPLKGLEHLGRHIRDRFGAPSGSMANFEATRGMLDPDEAAGGPTPAEIAAHEAAIVKDLAAPRG